MEPKKLPILKSKKENLQKLLQHLNINPGKQNQKCTWNTNTTSIEQIWENIKQWNNKIIKKYDQYEEKQKKNTTSSK